MNDEQTIYDVAIAGGGLAGLSAAILLARKGHKVVLFEKEQYPFHKVCGEYISMESWPFLNSLGLPLEELQLPRIKKLLLTSPSGKTFETDLPLGGFGISRYLLDESLMKIAKSLGVVVREQTKVTDIEFDQIFTISHNNAGVENITNAKLALGAYGKKSNLDVRWKRKFLDVQNKRLDNFLAVKYHVKTNWPNDVIGLHNFQDGYCGISKIENDRYCLCYMTRAVNLKKAGNSIALMEKEILFSNPHLKKIFTTASIEKDFPITISQINFSDKTRIENNLLMLGDTAGMITPLCGNGMSIALHTGKIAASLTAQFLQNKISLQEMHHQYEEQWNKLFRQRLRTGRVLQKLFGSAHLTDGFVSLLKILPLISRPLIRMTHGEPY